MFPELLEWNVFNKIKDKGVPMDIGTPLSLKITKMHKEPFYIKTDSKIKIGMILLACFVIITMFFIPLENGKTNYKQSPIYITIVCLIALIIIIVNAYKLIKRSSSITISSEGIKWSGMDLYPWKDISSFEIIYYHSSENAEEEIVLHFTSGKKRTYRIDYLEVNYSTLVDKILEYQNNHGILYLGHKEI